MNKASYLEKLAEDARRMFPSTTDRILEHAQMNADDSGFVCGTDEYRIVFLFSVEEILKEYPK